MTLFLAYIQVYIENLLSSNKCYQDVLKMFRRVIFKIRSVKYILFDILSAFPFSVFLLFTAAHKCIVLKYEY